MQEDAEKEAKKMKMWEEEEQGGSVDQEKTSLCHALEIQLIMARGERGNL